jgi:Tfp pilus assembly protein PilF
LYSGDGERGRVQLVLPPSAADLRARHEAASEEITKAHQLFENRDYKAAIEACDRAISIDPDSQQESEQLRQQIGRTMNILGIQ